MFALEIKINLCITKIAIRKSHFMKKIGILGGGQLGKMLCLAAANWDLDVYVLEDDENCPAAPYCTKLVKGSFKNYDDVVAFGQLVDVLTIEIEHVNTDALRFLEKKGKIVHPNPKALDLIKDKGLQKQFYLTHKIPTAAVFYYENKADFENKIDLPCVWKSRKGGYDGKGVSIVKTKKDLENLPDEPCIIEELIDIDKEIAVIACRNPSGQIITYPSVEMVFDEKANLLDYQMCPSTISKAIEKQAQNLAKIVIKKFKLCGLLAVEMFLTKDGRLLVNEVAPRPHNSGHHTIEAMETSQFEQHLRAILDLPLGSTRLRFPSVLLNLVGAEGFLGKTKVEGWETALNTEGVHIHLYGKKTTKPFRKMGHITIINKSLEKAKSDALILKNDFKITAQ
jgi:5-(carboxyamino)imidazole ribonucleotide synthase